jgi:hypothetical protein
LRRSHLVAITPRTTAVDTSVRVSGFGTWMTGAGPPAETEVVHAKAATAPATISPAPRSIDPMSWLLVIGRCSVVLVDRSVTGTHDAYHGPTGRADAHLRSVVKFVRVEL